MTNEEILNLPEVQDFFSSAISDFDKQFLVAVRALLRAQPSSIHEAEDAMRAACWDLCDQYAEELLGMSDEGLTPQEKEERLAQMDTARLLARRIREET